MSNDESILSGASGTGADGGSQAHLVNVLANVVETQKSVASQFSALFDRVEEARKETRKDVDALSAEIRKMEIRRNTMFEKVATQLAAQNEALHSSHAAERVQLIAQNENVMNLLKSTINSAPRPDLTHQQRRDLQDRMLEMLLQQIQERQQQRLLAWGAAASSTTIAARSQMPSAPTAAVPSVPVVHAAPTVTSVPPPVVVTQQSASKVEMKPVVPSPATTVAPAKPMYSFGSPSAASKPIFGDSMAPAAVPAAPPAAASPFSFFVPKPAFSGQSTSVVRERLLKPSILEQKDKVAEGQKNFASLAKSKSAAVAATSTVTSKDEDGEERNPIQLPELDEVTTEEENGTVLFSARSKIFRYVRETKEYKERGVGDLKLLRDEANNKFRVVMRRDQDHKLCANFSVLKTAKFITKEGQDNVRSIAVNDFAENENGDIVSMCLKFENAEVAKEFENAFEDARAQLQ